MPNYLTVAVPSHLEKSGFLSAPSVSTAASTLSPTTTVGADADDEFTMLARLQGLPIHAPPGPHPLVPEIAFPPRLRFRRNARPRKTSNQKQLRRKNKQLPLIRSSLRQRGRRS
jgi:hypothetical protein